MLFRNAINEDHVDLLELHTWQYSMLILHTSNCYSKYCYASYLYQRERESRINRSLEANKQNLISNDKLSRSEIKLSKPRLCKINLDVYTHSKRYLGNSIPIQLWQLYGKNRIGKNYGFIALQMKRLRARALAGFDRYQK